MSSNRIHSLCYCSSGYYSKFNSFDFISIYAQHHAVLKFLYKLFSLRRLNAESVLLYAAARCALR
jgi:hypothetical protein